MACNTPPHPSSAVPASTNVDTFTAQSIPNFARNISAGPENESSQDLTFTQVSNNLPMLFDEQPVLSNDGRLTFRAKRYISGTARITVRLQDNGGTANGGVDTTQKSFDLVIDTLNQRPRWQQPEMTDDDPRLLEDQTNPGAFTSVLHIADALGFQDDDTNQGRGIAVVDATEANGTWQFSTNGGVSWTNLFDVQEDRALLLEADGNRNNRIRFIPAVNFFGEVTVTVRAWDMVRYPTGSGGRRDVRGSSSFSEQTALVKITVFSVNDPPSFNLSGTTLLADDTSTVTVNNFAVDIRPGPANEGAQQIAFDVEVLQGANLLTGMPSLSNAGALTFRAQDNQQGTVQVRVRLRDDGGQADGGDDDSGWQEFTILVDTN